MASVSTSATAQLLRGTEAADGQLKPQIPWLRVFVEGVVIIGSILLAFGLQAWWDGVQLAG